MMSRPAHPLFTTVSARVGSLAALLVASLLASPSAHAGAFIFASESAPNNITHPTGYTGSGGTLSVSVCIDPGSANANDMVVPVQNIVATYNDRVSTTGNLVSGGSNNVPSGFFDWESVALHEVGHCIGMAHVNLASESGVGVPDQNFTKSSDGADNSYGLDRGVDNVRGSSDDQRGDDDNLHWFRKSTNDPFTIDSTIDASTYSRQLADLPPGHDFATNADRTVAALLGFPNSEAVMQQGTFSDEAQRTLVHDDVATLSLAMSGLDETAGNADDYTLQLTYGGLSSSCDVVLDFDNAQTGFAVCQVSGSFLNGTHLRITSAKAYFNNSFNWFFNDVSLTTTTSTTSTTSTTTTTLPNSPCAVTPEVGCRTVEVLRSRLQLQDRDDDSKDKLDWRWRKGVATVLADFKDPIGGSATNQFCVYDSSASPQPLMDLTVFSGGTCNGKPCWKTQGATTLRYKNKLATPQGVRDVKLREGVTGKAQVDVKGKGAALSMPTLGLTLPVTAQWLIDDGITTECWQTVYTAMQKNESREFRAKGP